MRLSLEQLCTFVAEYVRQEHPHRTPVALRIKLDNGQDIRSPISICKPGRGPAAEIADTPEFSAQQPLTECEKDILVLIEEGAQRLTIPKVLSGLDAAGKIHGESTVRRALANLHNRLDLLTNRTDAYGKGYGLAEW